MLKGRISPALLLLPPNLFIFLLQPDEKGEAIIEFLLYCVERVMNFAVLIRPDVRGKSPFHYAKSDVLPARFGWSELSKVEQLPVYRGDTP